MLFRSDRISNSEIGWKEVLRKFWTEFSAAIADTTELERTKVLDAMNETMGPHIFPARGDGADPRTCPSCSGGRLSLKLGKFGAFVGCSNYPECRFTRQLGAPNADGDAAAEGGTPGTQILGKDPVSGEDITLRDGRFGPYVQRSEEHTSELQSH